MNTYKLKNEKIVNIIDSLGGKFRSIFRLDNGDLQLGDWKYRIDLKGTFVMYIATRRCNFNCPYCLLHEPGPDDSLVSRFGIEKVTDAFRVFQEQTGRKLYVLFTGGEPFLQPNFGDLVARLTEFLEIGVQTNLCTKGVEEFGQKVSPEHIGQVEAAFHYSVLDKNPKLEEKYFKNFKWLTNRGFSIVCKFLAAPWELPPSHKFQERLCRVREKLPSGTIFYIKHLIGKWNDKFYPHSSTTEQREFLNQTMTVRRTEELYYAQGAWFFKNMPCDAGHGMVTMQVDGEVNRCLLDHNSLGNLMQKNIRLSAPVVSCQFPACYSPPYAFWYGFQPWKYFTSAAPGAYNRFAANNINSLEEISELLRLGQI